jgi:hypothetical protein
MRSVALACLLLLPACSPVLLFGDEAPVHDAAPPAGRLDAGAADAAAASSGASGETHSAAPSTVGDAGPRGLITVRGSDCNGCFELVASGTGGTPPYQYEWNDGMQGAQHRTCVGSAAVDVSVIVQDANLARSSASGVRLDGNQDAGCPAPPQTPSKLCVTNPSFEGTAAVNIGVPATFDAAPWNACISAAAAASGTMNTPDIGDQAAGQTLTQAPTPTDGNTYLALAQGEQVSQQLCEAVSGGTAVSMRIDLSRVDLGPAIVPATQAVFIEIWGGIAAECSQRALLWASPGLDPAWKTYCAKLKPPDFMDQITLRATSNDVTTSSYLLVDNLVPVDDCP